MSMRSAQWASWLPGDPKKGSASQYVSLRSSDGEAELDNDDEGKRRSSTGGRRPWPRGSPSLAEGPHSVADSAQPVAAPQIRRIAQISAVLLSLLSLLLFASSRTSSSYPRSSLRSNTTLHSSEPPDRPLITYVFYETPDALRNLDFFLRHALHGSADFLFVVNGNSTLAEFPDHLPNVKVIHRANACYDMGAYGDIFNREDRALVKRYSRFILMNASIMGPFMPRWSNQCWSDAYLAKVTSEVKLVGMTANCLLRKSPKPHVQSMIFATDRIGLEVLLDERNTHSLSSCPSIMTEAIAVEVSATQHILDAGYYVDVMQHEFSRVLNPTRNYMLDCTHGDYLYKNRYFGGNVSPFETLFTKTKRGAMPQLLDKLKEFTDTSGYSSYDYC